MTDVSEGQWRWPLPDEWEPEGFWCVQITIPADQQYMDRLTGALGLLTTSRSWFPEPDYSGPVAVAFAWENALYMKHFKVSQTCFVRPPIIIVDNDGAEDAAAAIFTVVFENVIQALNGCATTPDDCETCIDDLMDTLAPYNPSDAVRGALERLCRDLNALSSEDRAVYETNAPYIDLFHILAGDISDTLIDWLDELADWLANSISETLDDIVNDLAILGAFLGGDAIGQFIEDNGGIPEGGGADFDAPTTWSHTFDFTLSDGWFIIAHFSGQDRAVYTPGVGFTSAYFTPDAGTGIRLTDISIPMASRTITGYSLTYTRSEGEVTNTGLMYTEINDSASPRVRDRTEGTDLTLTISGTFPGEVGFNLFGRAGYQQSADNHDPGGTETFTALTVQGIGTDPFV